MATEQATQEMQKTQVFNVIILDRSGSMGCIRRAAVDGFNETLAGIKKAQEKFEKTQEHFVTLVAFCCCETEYIFDKVPVAEARPLSLEDYRPCCGTPLYDAMGFTLTQMQKHMAALTDAVVVVTIITDGMENSSREYTGSAIRRLVSELREDGWTFTYMGANQDSVEVAMTLSIRNARNFDYSSEGTMHTMQRDAATRLNFYSRLDEMKCADNLGREAALPARERRRRYTAMADEAFDEVEREGK